MRAADTSQAPGARSSVLPPGNRVAFPHLFLLQLQPRALPVPAVLLLLVLTSERAWPINTRRKLSQPTTARGSKEAQILRLF